MSIAYYFFSILSSLDCNQRTPLSTPAKSPVRWWSSCDQQRVLGIDSTAPSSSSSLWWFPSYRRETKGQIMDMIFRAKLLIGSRARPRHTWMHCKDRRKPLQLILRTQGPNEKQRKCLSSGSLKENDLRCKFPLSKLLPERRCSGTGKRETACIHSSAHSAALIWGE